MPPIKVSLYMLITVKSDCYYFETWPTENIINWKMECFERIYHLHIVDPQERRKWMHRTLRSILDWFYCPLVLNRELCFYGQSFSRILQCKSSKLPSLRRHGKVTQILIQSVFNGSDWHFIFPKRNKSRSPWNEFRFISELFTTNPSIKGTWMPKIECSCGFWEQYEVSSWFRRQ